MQSECYRNHSSNACIALETIKEPKAEKFQLNDVIYILGIVQLDILIPLAGGVEVAPIMEELRQDRLGASGTHLLRLSAFDSFLIYEKSNI